METKGRFRQATLAVTLLCFPGVSAASTLYTGTNTSDGDLTWFVISVTSSGNFTAQSMGYGGWSSPAVAHGGFATSLSLYEVNDALDSQLAHDYLGGTSIGPNCSNGAKQDPTSHLCEDAMITSFPLGVGKYILTLTEQGDDGPDPLDFNNFPLAPGSNFPGGPFLDPGNGSQRNGNWAVQLSFTGADTLTESPEPAAVFLSGLGLAALAFATRRHNRTNNQKDN